MNDFSVQQGWQCPLCKRVYSPFTPCCFYCGEEGMTKTSTGTDWQKHQSVTTAEHGILGQPTLRFINGECDYICNPKENDNE